MVVVNCLSNCCSSLLFTTLFMSPPASLCRHHFCLQEDILRLEFDKLNPDENGKIKEVKFARMLLAYSGLSDNKQKNILKVILLAAGCIIFRFILSSFHEKAVKTLYELA